MSRTRKTAGKPRWSRNGMLTDSGAHQVYAEFRDCLVNESDHDHVEDGPACLLPLELDGPASLLPPKHTPKLRSRRLPHPDNVRAMLARAYESLNRPREKKPEVLYLRLALRRFLTLDVTLEQAFGLGPLPGRPPDADDRGHQIAVAVLRQYVTQPGTLENAAAIAGKGFGIRGKTQALEAFGNNALHALRALYAERRDSNSARLWTSREEHRLNRYYRRRQCDIREFLSKPKQPGNSP